MISFKPKQVNMDDGRTPVMYDRDIDEFAHSVLADYRPELLKEPGKIDVEHFLENYLGAEIQFLDLYNDDPKKQIYALTAFTDGYVKIFDRENECISDVYVPARTVILDNEIMQKGKEFIALFSGLHESGHLVYHWNVFVDEDGLPYERNSDNASVICCYRKDIENFTCSRKKKTPAEWREHQADYFAAAIAMPNITFQPFVYKFLRENNVYKRSIHIGADPDMDILADDILPDYISDIYGVSKRAARIKLRKGGFVIGEEKRRSKK